MSRLSVCFIAKNEEQNLPRALASVADVADEIIVTDTGSTDRTVEIAREAGATVERFTWIEDFSAARNHCHALASGDWILYLDADEELAETSRDELRACLARDDALAFTVLRQDLRDAEAPDQFTEMRQLRLFRGDRQLRMTGRIHERFDPPLAETAGGLGLKVLDSTIRLRHYGFVAELKRAKHERAARLLELELADRPGQFYFLVELGRTRLALGEERGIDDLREAARQVVEPEASHRLTHGAMALLVEFVLAAPQLPADFPLTKELARRLTRERFADSVPLLWHLARADFAAGRYGEAAQLLERIVALGSDHAYDHAISFNAALLGDDARMTLGACYVRLGRLKDAAQTFEQLLDSPTQGAAAKQNLAAVRQVLRRHGGA